VAADESSAAGDEVSHGFSLKVSIPPWQPYCDSFLAVGQSPNTMNAGMRRVGVGREEGQEFSFLRREEYVGSHNLYSERKSYFVFCQ
jgi:hypothetical protein